MQKRYQPPRQSGLGQFLDCVFLLAIVYASLLAPIVLDFGGGVNKHQVDMVQGEQVTWEALGQNEVMQAQWQKLGYDAEGAAEIITSRFDYSIDPLALVITAAVIIGYFVFILKVSAKEYRDVIRENFDTD
ncbi:hypothetical protein [Ferruginivarius sediminum]|uniref:Uncharacterized protein n=1 Tax=Ferruginivarius sediminum TaxID=2661937 RepID=A0A369T965_9PROT|nr:hypothetical protein [Ferruginivarius sediminum]RDD61024.1 hypothetical protein DRB17_14960 [Ferruginivarius sediminum]